MFRKKEEFGDIKEVIGIRKSKDKQHNGQMKKDKMTKWSTKHTHKTKYRVTRTPLKTGGGLGCSGRVSIICFTNDARRVTLVTDLVISHKWEKDREVFTSGTYPWSLVTDTSTERINHLKKWMKKLTIKVSSCTT